jgi:GntR family transcriptional regulator
MTFIEAIKTRMEGETGPLTVRLQNSLIAAIESGAIPAGKTLPAERELALMLDVSRSTLRDCLQELAARQLVRTKRGAGTEVVGQVRKALSLLSGFTEDMRARGLIANTRVLDRTIGPASSDISFRTGLPLGTSVMKLSRLRFAAGEVFSFERVTVPLSAVGEDYDGISSLYARMDERGLRPKRILQNLRAVEATKDLASKLETATGAALLEISQVGYAANGQAVEDALGWYRGDRFQYVGEITG